MLGIFGNNALENYTDGREYADILFHGRQGDIAYCTKRGEKMVHIFYRASGIAKADYDGIVDCYVSMNTFTKNERKTEHLKRLCNLYVDLDIYKSEYRDMPKEAIVQILYDDFFGSKIPFPTFIIDSGNGMYLIWHLKNEDRNALPRYLALEQYLVDTLAEFGADKACKDASRILRVPGTVNSKCGKTVRIMEYTDITYTLYELGREYDVKPLKSVYTAQKGRKEGTVHPYGTATEKMRILAAKIATEQGVELPNFENFQATFEFISQYMPQGTDRPEQSKGILGKIKEKVINFANTRARNFMLKSYIADIETVILSRKGGDCKREIALFLYRLFVQEATGDATFALEKTLELNGKLSCPFSDRYVEIRTKSAQTKIDSGDTYHYKKSTIIEALEITQEEMKTLKLHILTDFADPKERKAQSNRRAYERKLMEQGKETKRETVKKRREQIAAMLAQGDSPENIIETLNISKATYYRDYAVIAAQTCVEACTRAVEATMENVATTMKKAVETAKKAITGQTEGDSQKFSPTIIENAVGVPHVFTSTGDISEIEGERGMGNPPPFPV